MVIKKILFIGFILFILFLNGCDKCCMCGSTCKIFKDCCCPCPNKDVINEVEDYVGYQASSAGSWFEMCNKYMEETNKTIECWED